MNLRPPGPQPGALPDCATPRGPSILRRRRHSDVRGGCEHVFVPTDEPPMRKCGRCGQVKSASDFSWHRKARNQRDSYCRICRAAYKREHYLAHRERYVENAVRRKRTLIAERVAYLVAFLRDHPCVDCGEPDTLVLEFDHIGHKRFSISAGLRGRNWQSVLDEMTRCDVVCANCHRRRTARRGGFMRAVAQQHGRTVATDSSGRPESNRL